VTSQPYSPEEDACAIWSSAYLKGREKYDQGQKEHKTMFHTAGASWYAAQIRDEAIDTIAYTHHLYSRMDSIRSLARMMKEDDGMTLSMAATILEYLCGNHPPKAWPTHGKHD
jgi:hypothetical protein